MIKKFFSGLLVTIISIVITIILLEFLTKNFFKPLGKNNSPQSLYVNDKITGYKLNSNFSGMLKIPNGRKSFIKTGNLGNRCTNDFCKNKLITIATFGDSYTFGYGVDNDETWQRYLSKTLNTGILNFGTPGYNIEQTRRLIEMTNNNFILPNKIIIGVSWNDVFEGTNVYSKKVKNGWLVNFNTPRLLVFLRNNPLIYKTSLGSVLFKTLNNIERFILKTTPKDRNNEMELSLDSLNKLVLSNALKNKEVYLVFFNTASHIKWMSTESRQLKPNPLNYPDLFLALTNIIENINHSNLIIIDTTAEMVFNFKTNPYYLDNEQSHNFLFLENDQHYNKFANQKIADLIYRKIK